MPTESPPTLRALRVLRDTVWQPTGPSMRGWALAGIGVNVTIVLIGATVRLTESGLGCPSWPRCTGDSLVPVAHEDTPTLNMVIEFGNRLASFVVLAVGAACLLAAVRLRPRRHDLVQLALVLPLGALVQAGIGGMTVLTGLQPHWVAGHFLVSAGIIAAAVGLHERAGEGDERPHLLVRAEIRWLVRGLIVAVGLVLVLGTVVTGTGPHGGDPASPRFGFSIPQVTHLHADAAWASAGLAFALLLAVRVTDAPTLVRRRALHLFALVFAQGALGYLQYALEVPASLVGLHILGATLVWVAAWRVRFALRERGAAPAPSGGHQVPAPLG